MAVAETVTKLPLATWAKIMGMHPLHFHQVRLSEVDPHCSGIIFQHEWQTADHVSREEIARAIKEAEEKIEGILGYRLAPSWEIDEWHQTQRHFRRDLVNLTATDIAGYKQVVRANWGHLISGGIQSKELIQANRPIAYTDVNSDSYEETATVTVATTVVDKNEIAIFYPGHAGEDEWEIRPAEVSIVGGTATIVFRRELAVIENLLSAFDIEGGEAIGTDDSDFLTLVDVYRRYNDPQTQANFLWEPTASGWCTACNGEGCQVCSYTTQNGCLILRSDPRISMVGYSPGIWNVDDDNFDIEPWAITRQPDLVRLYYYAGWRDKSAKYVSRMAPEWERVVAHMAASMLDRPPCDCSEDTFLHWRQDLTLVSGSEDGKPFFRTAQGVEDNPFGTRRGEVEAWRKVRNLMTASAVSL